MKSKNIKKIILGSFLGIIIGSLIGTAYAMFTYNSTSTNSKLVVGDIYMKYKETTALTLENAMPSTTYDSNYKFEFTIEGKNTTTDKDIWYEIKVKRGDIPNGKIEQDRIPDRFIKYRLVEQIDNGEEVVVVDEDSWEGLNLGKTIYVDKINKNQTTNTEHKYKLYMWISNKLVIGNDANADFTIANWNKAFASIKVDVNGDFTEKKADEPYMTINAMNTFPTVITDQKANIKEVYFDKMSESTMNTRYNAATIKADLTYNNEGKVLAWLEPTQADNTKYIMYVASDGDTYLTTGRGMFDVWTNLEIAEFNNVNTTRVSEMLGMFNGCAKIEILDLSSFSTSNVTATTGMFSGDSILNKIYVSDLWNLSNVDSNQTNGMFYGCVNLVGGNGTTGGEETKTVASKMDKTYAIVDGTNGQPGYLTDIADKSNN